MLAAEDNSKDIKKAMCVSCYKQILVTQRFKTREANESDNNN